MILGVDVSFWQGLMDWQICQEAGARFAFIRAGSCNNVTGRCYEDFLFKENAEDATVPFGFYWYFRPNHNPTVQADYFCNLIKDIDWRMLPVMDIESTGGKNPGEVGDAAAEFVSRIYTKLDTWPLIYTRGYFWNDKVNYRSVFDECDLWVARYTSKDKPWDNLGDHAKLAPNYWTDWTFWQYTSQGDAVTYGGPGPPSGDDDIDLNRFNGDEDAFNEYVGYTVDEGVLPSEIGIKANIEIEGEDVKYKGKIQRL